MTGFLDMTANQENTMTDQKNLLSPSCNALSTLHLKPCGRGWGGTHQKHFFFQVRHPHFIFNT